MRREIGPKIKKKYSLPKSGSLVLDSRKINSNFFQEGAEKSSVESGSLDLLTICEALHWADIDVAMKKFARQLKKGGTLQIAHYWRPYTDNEALQELWKDL